MPLLTLGPLLLPPLLLILHLVHQYLGTRRPLNAIPNAHPTAPFSSLWLLSIRYRKRENRTVWASHKRLGPVVRLAPDEVSVCTLQGLKTIYGDWGKNAWYEAFINYGYVELPRAEYSFLAIYCGLRAEMSKEGNAGQHVDVSYHNLTFISFISFPPLAPQPPP
jgi:hypothetical protein